jgi:hypothetical protein
LRQAPWAVQRAVIVDLDVVVDLVVVVDVNGDGHVDGGR